jgi:elongation factor 1-gamma
LFDAVYRGEYPNVVRYWTLIRNFKPYLEVMGPPKFIEKRIQYTRKPPFLWLITIAPKKEPAPKKEAPKPKEAPKKKEKEEDVAEEEDDVPKEKAPKHPLAALPPSTIPIDEWKRQYSNNNTDVALKWFWEHYNPKDFSLWRVDYKVTHPVLRELTFSILRILD